MPIAPCIRLDLRYHMDSQFDCVPVLHCTMLFSPKPHRSEVPYKAVWRLNLPSPIPPPPPPPPPHPDRPLLHTRTHTPWLHQKCLFGRGIMIFLEFDESWPVYIIYCPRYLNNALKFLIAFPAPRNLHTGWLCWCLSSTAQILQFVSVWQ